MLQELIKLWMIPPALNFIAVMAGLLMLKWFNSIGKVIIGVSLLSLLLLSTDFIASVLELSIQEHPALALAELPQEQLLTIVVAGASHHDRADEYGYSTPTSGALVRLHYAANLHRQTGFPVLLTGGPMRQNIHSEVLARSFSQEFKIDALWSETKSRSTHENAKYSAEILLPLGRKTILLVTHSYHMKRSVKSFQTAGFTVIPAPTILSRKLHAGNWRYWIPSAPGLQRSSNVIYEYLALVRDKFIVSR
ncbi:YdcF family protein [Granulosicoccus sp.]|nr:YdcF family protein [Granulosicoccus sp.]MDB4222323.1 YdcF family protein [Granulosicoccus sp.]